MISPVALLQAGHQFPHHGDKGRFCWRDQAPDEVRRSLIAERNPLTPGPRVVHRDELPPPLMINRQRNNEVVLASHLEDVVDVLEVSFVGGEHIVVMPRLLAMNIGIGAFPHTREHDLGEHESVLFAFLDDQTRLLDRVSPDEFPLGRAQAKHRRASLLREIAMIAADL
jgi:hypothetical protein